MSAEMTSRGNQNLAVDDDFLSNFRQLLRENCQYGMPVQFKLTDILGHFIVTTKVQKLLLQELIMVTDQCFKASKSYNIDPGTKVSVSFPIDQGEMIFEMVLEKSTFLPSENYFRIIPQNVVIRKRQHPRIDCWCEGSVLDHRQRVVLSILSPLKASFSQSGLRLWLETGNLNINTDYTLSLRFSYSPKDLKSPRLKVECDWHVIEVKLYGDGVKEAYNYQAAGYFKNHEHYLETFNDFVQKYQSYKAITDINRFRATKK